MPAHNVQDMVVTGDSYDDSEHDDSDSILERPTSQPFPTHPRNTTRPNFSGAALPQNLRSPTLSPSRRDLERWTSQTINNTACCTHASYAGSTATTASLMSEEDLDVYLSPKDVDEIKSNATTQVVSHRNGRKRNDLLTSTLASAEQRLREQLRAEEQRSESLQSRRQLT
eukprot:Nitzschia sp. Nitz4//scaffold124_size66437//42703//43212//NITZ4_006114-RA/size66437-processed-gene-0.102-mRNA-1//-1//CDS//3329534561//6854//frame0